MSFKIILTLVSILMFLLLSGCTYDSEPLAKQLISSISLPSKITKEYSVTYSMPQDAVLDLYIKAEKTNTLIIPPRIKEKCHKKHKKNTLSNLNGYNNHDKKNYDKSGKLTLRGQVLVQQARKHAEKACVNKFIFGNINLNIATPDRIIFSKEEVSIDHSLMQQSTYYLIQLNDHIGFFKKGTKLKIDLTTLVVNKEEYKNNPVNYELIAILSERKLY